MTSDYDSDDDYFFNEPASKLKSCIDIAALRRRLNIDFEIEDATSQNEKFQNKHNNSVYAQSDKCEINTLEEFNDDFESNSDIDELEPFEYVGRKMKDITGNGGVLKKIKQEGIGGSLPEGAYVTYHYSFYLELADEPFDSSLLRKPCKTSLKNGEMIPGIVVGINSMRKKEKSLFLIRSDYAFGAMGCPPRIPGDSSILAEITLLDYADYYEADAYDDMEDQIKHTATFDEKLKAAKAHQRRGTDSFKNDSMQAAKNSYYKALWIMKTAINRDENDEKQQLQFMFRMHVNLAQVFLKLHQAAKACSMCQDALKLPGKFDNQLKAKLYFRFGRAKMLLDGYDEAEKYLKMAQKLSPNSSDIANEMLILYEKEEKSKEREAVMCQKMFKNLKVDNVKPKESVNNKVELSKTCKPIMEVIDNIDYSEFEFVGNTGGTNEEEEVKPRMSIESFEEAISEQLRVFNEDSKTMHISLPTGLSREEIHVARGVVSEMNLLVDTEGSGPRSHLIVYKMLKDNPLYREQFDKNI